MSLGRALEKIIPLPQGAWPFGDELMSLCYGVRDQGSIPMSGKVAFHPLQPPTHILSSIPPQHPFACSLTFILLPQVCLLLIDPFFHQTCFLICSCSLQISLKLLHTTKTSGRKVTYHCKT